MFCKCKKDYVAIKCCAADFFTKNGSFFVVTVLGLISFGLLYNFVFEMQPKASDYATVLTGFAAVVAAFVAFYSSVEQAKRENLFRQYEIERDIYIKSTIVLSSLRVLQSSIEMLTSYYSGLLNRGVLVLKKDSLNLLSKIFIDKHVDRINENLVGLHQDLVSDISVLLNHIKQDAAIIEFSIETAADYDVPMLIQSLNLFALDFEDVISVLSKYLDTTKANSLASLKKSVL